MVFLFVKLNFSRFLEACDAQTAQGARIKLDFKDSFLLDQWFSPSTLVLMWFLTYFSDLVVSWISEDEGKPAFATLNSAMRDDRVVVVAQM